MKIHPMTIVIPIHSTVDLITNSSSELFVCHSSQTLTAIKDIIKTYCNELDLNVDEVLNDRIKLFITEYDYNISDFPEFKEYKQHCDDKHELIGLCREAEEKFKNIQPPNFEQDELYDSQSWAINYYQYDYASKLADKIVHQWKKKNNIKRMTSEVDYILDFAISECTDIPKGTVIIKSASDNSIPYDLSDKIKNNLNGKSYFR